jgi:HEAT repeat protein
LINCPSFVNTKRKNTMKKVLPLMLLLGLMAPASHADVFEDLAGYTYGADPNVAQQVMEQMLAADAAGRPAIEQKLAAVVANADATQDGKAWACRYLQIIGTEASIPALSTLLQDVVLADYARLPLERMVGSAAASAALRNALSDAPAAVQIGLLGSLGELRDARAVKAIGKLAKSDEAAVSVAAMTALGKIADKRAIKTLSKLKSRAETQQAYLDAIVQAGQRAGASSGLGLFEKALASDSTQHRVAGLLGILTVEASKGAAMFASAVTGTDAALRDGALNAAVVVPGKELTDALVGVLDQLEAPAQAQLINVLGARGDRDASAAVIALLDSENEAVKNAASAAMTKLGNAAIASDMLKMAANAENADAMINIVAQMAGSEIDGAVIAALGAGPARLVALKVVTQRGIVSACDAILKCLSDADLAVQEESWKALGMLGGVNQIAPMMGALVAVKDAGMQDKAANATMRVFSLAGDKGSAYAHVQAQYDKASDRLKKHMLKMASMAGTPGAAANVDAALASGNADLYDVALRNLADWPNESVASRLLELAKSSSTETQRILAMRGFLRIAGMKEASLSVGQRAAMLKAAADVAERAEEKKQIIAALRGQHTPISLEALLVFAADDAFLLDADDAIRDLSGHLAAGNKAAVSNALGTVVKRLSETGADAARIKQTTDLLNGLK